MDLRSTYADTASLQYRLRAACSLLDVTDNTLRSYSETCGVVIKRASDITPGAPAVRVFDPASLFEMAQWRRSQGFIKSLPDGAGPMVVAIDVVKGGTGKTTTAVELAIHLQFLGQRVLLIDLDGQSNATQLMGYEPDLDLNDAEPSGLNPDAIITATFKDVMEPFITGVEKGLERFVVDQPDLIKKPFGSFGPHLIGADANLFDMDRPLNMANGSRELYMRSMFGASRAGLVRGFDVNQYDVIILDCPPNVSMTSSNALAASDVVVAPVRLDAFSVKGLTRLMREIKVIDKHYKVHPNLVILPTHHQPHFSRICRMQNELAKYREMLADNFISHSEEFPKSLDMYLPLSLQKPTSNASKEYRMFAEFMLNRLLELSSSRKK